jgi:transcriptional regulator with XRE-family HTH domain
VSHEEKTLKLPVSAVTREAEASGVVELGKLGELLVSERQRKRLSQRGALAVVRKRMGRGVSMSTLQAWEAGERLPEGAEMVTYLRGVGASPRALLALLELLRPAPPGVALHVSAERCERLLASAPRDLEATVLPMLYELLRCWAELAALEQRLRQIEARQGQAPAAPEGQTRLAPQRANTETTGVHKPKAKEGGGR